MIPAVAKSQVGRGSVAAPARLEAKADEILKVHRDAAKVAKARKLSPAFDAECAAADKTQFPQTWMELAGWLWGYWWVILSWGAVCWFTFWAWPFLMFCLKLLVWSPLIILLWLFSSRRPRGNRWGYYTRGGSYRIR